MLILWLNRIISWITLGISLLVLGFIPIYLVFSFVEIVTYPDYLGIVLNFLLLAIEAFGYLFAFYLLYMISGAFKFRSQPPFPQTVTSFHPSFSIIVPSHGTPFPILKETLLGTLALKYDDYEIIVSDNGVDPKVTDQLREFCEEHQIPFHWKPDSRGFKAGNINAVLEKTHGDLIVILDSDHIPVPDLLTLFAEVMGDETIGYIQTKVSYRNLTKIYQAANSILYSQFFEVFEAAKDPRGVALFNGTTGCFRRDALLAVDGFSEETLIEDIDTSMKILARGYTGRFLNVVGSRGLVPESAKGQIIQLWRWAHGACSLLRLRFRELFKSPHLSWPKKLELILNTMAFFSGISIVLLISLLALLVLFDMPFIRPVIFEFHLGYLLPSLVGISYSMAAFLAILWEPRQQHLVIRLLQLIPFYLFSLGTFLYLISGIVEGLLLKNTPLTEGSVWNREIRVVRNSLFALLFCGILVLIGIFGATHSFGLFVAGGAAFWMLAPLVLIYEEVNPPEQ
ncbi:MAG: glycosyltransferase family 2 protein [Candidatus Thorarchaeota archaeon]